MGESDWLLPLNLQIELGLLEIRWRQKHGKIIQNILQKSIHSFDIFSDIRFFLVFISWTDTVKSFFLSSIGCCFYISFIEWSLSVVITDISLAGIDAFLKQSGRSVIHISRRRTKAKTEYSQTEPLAIYWAVRSLHKFLYRWSLLSPQILKNEFLYRHTKSLTKSSAAMVSALWLQCHQSKCETYPTCGYSASNFSVFRTFSNVGLPVARATHYTARRQFRIPVSTSDVMNGPAGKNDHFQLSLLMKVFQLLQIVYCASVLAT